MVLCVMIHLNFNVFASSLLPHSLVVFLRLVPFLPPCSISQWKRPLWLADSLWTWLWSSGAGAWFVHVWCHVDKCPCVVKNIWAAWCHFCEFNQDVPQISSWNKKIITPKTCLFILISNIKAEKETSYIHQIQLFDPFIDLSWVLVPVWSLGTKQQREKIHTWQCFYFIFYLIMKDVLFCKTLLCWFILHFFSHVLDIFITCPLFSFKRWLN